MRTDHLRRRPSTVLATPRDQGEAAQGLFRRGIFAPSEDGDEESIVWSAETPPVVLPGEMSQTRKGSAAWRGRQTARRARPSSRPFRGRPGRAVLAAGRHRDLAWDTTVRVAAFTGQLPLRLTPADLYRQIRTQRPGRLLLLTVDVSGSMGTALMALAKKTALGLLEKAYVRRDHVAMVAFRERTASLLFPPTDQAVLVQRSLHGLRCGGTTPLAQGLFLADRTWRQARRESPDLEGVLLLISDGRANVGSRPGAAQIRAEVETAARRVRGREGLRILLVDATEAGKDDAPARWLAQRLGAPQLRLATVGQQGDDPAALLVRTLDMC